MEVKIQYNNGDVEFLDHTNFYKNPKRDDIYRFAIGTADFYNHDFYALEELPGGNLLISEWDLATSYPEQNWTEEGHACVYEVLPSGSWSRTQYGEGSPLPWEYFIIPTRYIRGTNISNDWADKLLDQWKLSVIDNWGTVNKVGTHGNSNISD